MKTILIPDSAALRATLRVIDARMAPLIEWRDKTQRELARAESLEFIRDNRIRRSDVETTDGPGKPWFGGIHTFVEWLRENSTLPYAEWNGRIYSREDLIANRMPPAPGRVSDLED